MNTDMPMPPHIPDNISELAGWQMACSCGKSHKVNTQQVILAPGAIDKLPAAIDERRLPRNVWLLADVNTYPAAGQRVCEVLREKNIAVETTILEPNETGYICADDDYLTRARNGIWDGAELFIGVGAGVINDLARLLVAERKVPYIVVATAASMNGYGSPISAVIENGVKVTKISAATDLIIADLDVLADAPVHLSQSGFGDLLAKNSSNADWYISGRVIGAYYCDRPVEMVRRAGERCLQVASKISDRDPQAIRVLTEGLIAGGFAMDAAGVTAPASGGEHLISHYMDMVAHLENYQPPLHGQQVALGTLIAAALYEKIRQVRIEKIDVDGLVNAYPDWPKRQQQLRAEHGELAEIIMPEAKAQQMTADQYRKRLATIGKNWQTIWHDLEGKIMSTEQIRNAYLAAGTPTRARDLDIPGELIVKAYRLARDIRSRYTILHLAGDLGLIDELADEVLEMAGVLR